MTTQDKIKFDKEALHQRYRVRDTDHDNVPDVFDCKPYDPTQDGFWGSVFSSARRAWSRAPVHFSHRRAASRRAAVRRAVHRSVRRGARAARHIIRRAPIHVSHVGAVKRRATIRRDITRTARPVAAAIHGIVERTGVDYERAKQRRGAVVTAGWHAPTRALTEIATMGAPFRKKMEQRIAATTARQQAKFPKGTLSTFSTRIAEGTARVARVARGFEKPIEQRMQVAEATLGLHSELIPAPLRWAGGQAKQFGYGVAFGAPAAMVEQAGMVPAAVETMVRRPEIIPAAVGVGIYTLGKGMFHGATTHPSRMAGEFVGMGAIASGAVRVAEPITPTILRGEGYVGVGLKGFKKPTYKTVTTEVSPKTFLKHEQAAGRIGKISYKPFTKHPTGESPLGTARLDIGEPAAITKPTQIYISPKTYAYSAMRKVVHPIMKRTKMDIYQQRTFRSQYPTHQEVLAHELIHHEFPQFSEGKVVRMTREFSELPSKKIFTIQKQVKTGYVREPIPLIGLRTKSGIPATEGITSTYRGLQIGKQWTPAEYYKASKITTIPTPKGTLFEAQRGTQLRIGQFRYGKKAVAKGAMEGGYFLQEPKAPVTPEFPELTTAEKGIIPTTPQNFPLSTEVISPKILKPTRFYGEISRLYVKGGNISLFGSKARMRWTEIGERRLTYGIEGAPRQLKSTFRAKRWGYRPTYPPGLASSRATTRTHIEGYAPKQIPPDIYFKTTGIPETSRFFDKPSEAIRKSLDEAERVRDEVMYAEPTRHAPEMFTPQRQRAVSPKPSAKVAYAEHPKPSETIRKILDEAERARDEVMYAEPTRRATEIFASQLHYTVSPKRKPRKAILLVPIPLGTEKEGGDKWSEQRWMPSGVPIPSIKEKEDDEWRKHPWWTPSRVPLTSTVLTPSIKEKEKEADEWVEQRWTPSTFPVPPRTPTPPPPTYDVPPSPPSIPPIIIPKTKGKKKLVHKRRKYKPKYWQIENPIANIQDMLFGRSAGQTRVQPSFSLPTRTPPKQSKQRGKKKPIYKWSKHTPKYGKIDDPNAKIRKVMFGQLEDRQLNK